MRKFQTLFELIGELGRIGVAGWTCAWRILVRCIVRKDIGAHPAQPVLFDNFPWSLDTLHIMRVLFTFYSAHSNTFVDEILVSFTFQNLFLRFKWSQTLVQWNIWLHRSLFLVARKVKALQLELQWHRNKSSTPFDINLSNHNTT